MIYRQIIVQFHALFLASTILSKLNCFRLNEIVRFSSDVFSPYAIQTSSIALGLSKTFDFIRRFLASAIQTSLIALGLSKTFAIFGLLKKDHTPQPESPCKMPIRTVRRTVRLAYRWHTFRRCITYLSSYRVVAHVSGLVA